MIINRAAVAMGGITGDVDEARSHFEQRRLRRGYRAGGALTRARARACTSCLGMKR